MSRFAQPQAKAQSTTARKPRVAKTRVAEDVQAAYAQPDPTDDDVTALFGHTFKLPSSKRVLISTVIGFCSYMGSMYLAAPIVQMATLAVLSLTGSAFIALMIWCIATVLSVWSAAVLGYNAFKFAMDFDAERISSIGASIKDASARKVSLVRGWFGRTEAVEA